MCVRRFVMGGSGVLERLSGSKWGGSREINLKEVLHLEHRSGAQVREGPQSVALC